MSTNTTEIIEPKNWTYLIVKFSIITVVLTISLVCLFTFGNLKEVGENFSRYRCNPILMPFAGSFGYDPKENFNSCIQTVFQSKAVEVFGPIYTILAGFTQIIELIVNVTLGIRKLFSNFLFGVNNFVRSVRDRTQSLMFNIRMSFLKLFNLMNRVYGTMYAVIFMGTSAMTAGFNIADNDLTRFLFEFCFDPETPVKMADGSYKDIQSIQIGDALYEVKGKQPIVSSVFVFDGTKTPMVKIHDVQMSAEHYVYMDDHWIPAFQHRDAIPVSSIPKLICLNVEGNQFFVGKDSILVADYDEHTHPSVIAKTQQIASQSLNNHTHIECVQDYSLGMDPNLLIKMKDDTWKKLCNITLGEHVWNSGKVLGIVQEQVDTYYCMDSMKFSASQLVFHNQTWNRMKNIVSDAVHEPTTLYSILTEHCGTIVGHTGNQEIHVRDYREVPLPEMTEVYQMEFNA